MNKIAITGRLAADADMRYTANNDAILNFRVADDVGYGDKKTTNWWACSLFGKRAEGLQQYLTKGQQVTIFGQAVLREWTNKEGIKQISPDIRVDEVQLMGGRNEGQQETGSYQKPAVSAPANAGSLAQIEDIPF